jgi:hypothetical protein
MGTVSFCSCLITYKQTFWFEFFVVTKLCIYLLSWQQLLKPTINLKEFSLKSNRAEHGDESNSWRKWINRVLTEFSRGNNWGLITPVHTVRAYIVLKWVMSVLCCLQRGPAAHIICIVDRVRPKSVSAPQAPLCWFQLSLHDYTSENTHITRLAVECQPIMLLLNERDAFNSFVRRLSLLYNMLLARCMKCALFPANRPAALGSTREPAAPEVLLGFNWWK